MKPVARRYTSVQAEAGAETEAEAEAVDEAEAGQEEAEDSFLASKSLRAVNPMLTGALCERRRAGKMPWCRWGCTRLLVVGRDD